MDKLFRFHILAPETFVFSNIGTVPKGDIYIYDWPFKANNKNDFGDYADIKNYAINKKNHCLMICGNIEMEISKIIKETEKRDFLNMYNLRLLTIISKISFF